MTCSNCFNGCAEITSDQCVKYTGPSIGGLGIETGDTLAMVEAQILLFLQDVMDGDGIFPDINSQGWCDLIQNKLPVSGPITLTQILTALLESACELQTQIDGIVNSIDTLEGNYTIGCLSGVTASSGTHDILQATITKLCLVNTSLGALALNLSTNYSSNGAQLDAYIANYLSVHQPSSSLMSAKMVPYVAYEFFGDLTGKFDANGVGIPATVWDKIYICNGYNGLTPDKRGRVSVGATSGPGPAITDPAVLPGGFNPAYSATPGSWTKAGANSVTLDATQMPIHTHTPTITLSDPTHTHFTVLNSVPATNLSNLTPIKYDQSDDTQQDYTLKGVIGTPNIGLTSPTASGVTVASQTNSNAGGGLAHSNIQPVIACYYIMYIP